MVYLPFHSSHRYLANQSSVQLEEHLTAETVLLVPLAPLEAVGIRTALGSPGLVCQAITHRVAERTGAVFAPVLQYTISTPRRAFAGTAGMHPRTMANALTEMLESWAVQGFRRFGIVDGTWFSTPAVAEAINRITRREGCEACALAWQTDAELRAMAADWFACPLSHPPEYALVCMSSYLDGGAVSSDVYPDSTHAVSGLATWSKRGRDPERFRKLFPQALVRSGMPVPDPRKGEQYMEAVVERLSRLMDRWTRP